MTDLMSTTMSLRHQKMSVDFCTHPYYPRLQYEGDEHCKLLHSAIPARIIRA
jgi:hypothetical protein